MIIGQLLINATKKLRIVSELKNVNIKNPRFEAEILLSNILSASREFILSHPDKRLNFLQIINYKLQIRKREKNIPLAYIIKNKQFYGYDFFVNKHVLIPRPETELIIDRIINYEIKNTELKTIIIDVGTGSGCIPIVLAKELNKNRLYASYFMFYAIDISKKVLKVFKKNIELHKIKNIKFYQGNLLEPVICRLKEKDKVIITANLPYLTPKQIKNSPSIQKEPKLALAAGNDGLKYYKKLFKQIKEIKNKNKTILCEIDHTQAKNISKLIKQILPKYNFEIKKDLQGYKRLVIIKNEKN